jgi:methylated-DNA-protein-cysteine methyltransferase-like protein
MQTFEQKVIEVVKGIPKGSVLTYGEVATCAGNAKASRAVGSIMAKNNDKALPCHRVVRADGSVGREFVSLKQAHEQYENYKDDGFFLSGISVYWAKGGQSGGLVSFSSSEEDKIQFMIKWVEKYLGVSREKLNFRLILGEIGESELKKSKIFWSTRLKIGESLIKLTINKKAKSKNVALNKGIMQFSMCSVDKLRILQSWQKLMSQYYLMQKP